MDATARRGERTGDPCGSAVAGGAVCGAQGGGVPVTERHGLSPSVRFGRDRRGAGAPLVGEPPGHAGEPDRAPCSEGVGPSRSNAARAASRCRGRAFGASRIRRRIAILDALRRFGATPHAANCGRAHARFLRAMAGTSGALRRLEVPDYCWDECTTPCNTISPPLYYQQAA